MARLFLQYLTKLPGLLSLKMNIDMDTLQWDELYTWILRLPNLKYNKLSLLVPFYFQPFPYHIDSISHLQHLVINHTCDLNNLLTVLTHTPYLTHLTCSHLTPTHATGIDLSSNDPSLKYVCIKKCSLKFDQFEILIKNFCSQLDILKFSTSGDRSYLNGDHWKQLISKHIPRLQIFNFEYTGAVLPYHPSHSSFSHFISSFWLEHKWFFELQICTSTTSPIEMKCSIQPFKKPWYQALDEQNFHPMTNDSNSTNGSFPCLRLVMEDLQLFGYNKIYEDYVNCIANQVEFTNLHIDLPQFSIFFLIQTLYLLPNLDSLTITSKHPETTKILSEEQTTMFNFISNHNKITKLNLEQMSEIDQVHILLSLCSNIHYFQVKCRNLFDAEWLLQYVLTQRLKTLLPNLKLISVWLANADDKIMNDLQKIIDTQKLLENYTIKRICDRIYVSWN